MYDKMLHQMILASYSEDMATFKESLSLFTSSLATKPLPGMRELEWNACACVFCHNIWILVSLTPPPMIISGNWWPVRRFGRDTSDVRRTKSDNLSTQSIALSPDGPPLVKIDAKPHSVRSERAIFQHDSGIQSNARWNVQGLPPASCTRDLFLSRSIHRAWRSSLDSIFFRTPKTKPSAPKSLRVFNVVFIVSKAESS